MDRDEIVRVFRAFEASGLEYVLIGATAMGFHGLVRATEDLDLFIRGTAENVERLRAALRASYANDPHIEEISAADLLGAYPAVRYYPPSGDLYFDAKRFALLRRLVRRRMRCFFKTAPIRARVSFAPSDGDGAIPINTHNHGSSAPGHRVRSAGRYSRSSFQSRLSFARPR